jgi:hypothetical protein
VSRQLVGDPRAGISGRCSRHSSYRSHGSRDGRGSTYVPVQHGRSRYHLGENVCWWTSTRRSTETRALLIGRVAPDGARLYGDRQCVCRRDQVRARVEDYGHDDVIQASIATVCPLFRSAAMARSRSPSRTNR